MLFANKLPGFCIFTSTGLSKKSCVISVDFSDPPSITPQCSTLCMIRIPAFFTCRELLNFVSPSNTDCVEIKIVRDTTPNQYMALLKFTSHVSVIRLLFFLILNLQSQLRFRLGCRFGLFRAI